MPTRTTPDAPSGCTNLKLRQMTRRVGRQYDARVAASGLKTTQYSLLSHVIRMGPVRPADLAAKLDMDASTLTRNLQPLVAQGWVEQVAGADARSRLVRITPAGSAKHKEAQKSWKLAQTEFAQRLGAERVARLHALIDECMALLGDAALEETDE